MLKPNLASSAQHATTKPEVIKTLAQLITLGMKNLIGLYPGTEYYAVRGLMHDLASKVEESGTAVAIVDMV